MEILKIAIVSILIVFVVVILKQVKPEIALAVSVIGSIILLSYILSYISPIVQVVDKIVSATGLNYDMFVILLKCVGIGYLVEFCVDICIDSGNQSIANKLILGGKICILIVALPIITELFDIILELIS